MKRQRRFFQHLAMQGQGHRSTTAPNLVLSKATACGPSSNILKSNELFVMLTSVPSYLE